MRTLLSLDRPLSTDTSSRSGAAPRADLAERHNGVWGGCWCTWFHIFHSEKSHTAEGNHLRDQVQGAAQGDGGHATRSLFEQAGFTYSRPQGQAPLCDEHDDRAGRVAVAGAGATPFRIPGVTNREAEDWRLS